MGVPVLKMTVSEWVCRRRHRDRGFGDARLGEGGADEVAADVRSQLVARPAEQLVDELADESEIPEPAREELGRDVPAYRHGGADVRIDMHRVCATCGRKALAERPF